MKAKPYLLKENGDYAPCEVAEADHVAIRYGGTQAFHILPIILKGSRTESKRQPVWTWNGDTEKPTIKPSILHHWTDEQGNAMTCHTWVNDGMVQFLDDSTHSFKGKTVPLLDVQY